MSSQRSVSLWSEKEPWQVEFENEAINDERWNCIVTCLIETKVEDEECLRIFTQSVARGQIPLVRSITASDLFAKFKNESKSEDNRKYADRKTDRKVKEKHKDQRQDVPSVSHSSSRFPEVLALISKHVQSSEGQYSMPPIIMAYALKYMILEMKNDDCISRRINAALRRKTRESKLRAQIIRKLNGLPEERVATESDKMGYDNMWRREKFDILQGSPSQEGPFNGPEMYIVLSNFYNPLYFTELGEINVPFVAIIKVDNFKTISERASGSTGLKKQEGINYFWSEFEDGITGRSTTNLYKDIALLRYTPVLRSEHSVEEKHAIIVNELIATLYGAYHLNRLHQSYIRQMKIHRMIVSLEPLDLSRCEMYNKLCDALVTEDANCEIFIVFSMIEQVVCGIPETKARSSDYERESLEKLSDADEFKPCSPTVKGKKEEALVNMDYLSESLRERKRKQLGKQSKYPIIYFYGDLISLRIANVDQNILKAEAIFKRFVLNSVLPKISNKYPNLTPAEKTKNDFQFFRLWEKSKESEENFKVKLFFSIVMRLIERTQVFEGGCEDVVSSSASRGSSSESEKTKSSSNVGLPPGEDMPRETDFQEVAGLFYVEKKSLDTVKQKEPSTKVTLGLRKATAITEIAPTESTSLENLELACGRCQKFGIQNDEKKMDERENLTYLGQLLESCEISYLNEPNLLVNREEFETFVAKHNFYEILEPNRSVQRLQELYDNYNTVEYTYFSPTDTLFILGHNDADFRGVYHSQEKGYIASPLSLRDFFIFILPENRKWMEEEDLEYIRFLEGVREGFVEEGQRKDHEFKCKFLKKYYAMTESERKKLLEETQAEKEPDTKKRSLSDKRSAEELMLDGVEDLPVKAKQSQPKKFLFNGLNIGGVRTQVNVIGNEFHSDDGSIVGVKTLSWLYGSSLITLTVHRMGSKLYLHKWMEGNIQKESLHFKDSSGVLVTFDVDRSFPFFSKITWPNGLIIERFPVKKGLTSFYVKQTYLEKYRIEESIATENSRCFLPNGQILIFRANNIIDILCSNGTKHRCQVLEKKQKSPHCSPKTKDEKGIDELEIKVKETVTPEGEVWVADEGSKCMTLVKTMIFLIGVDPERNETFYRREDGTNCMLWPDGKLVISYSDGTKITSMPEFEEEEVSVNENTEIKKDSVRVNSKPRINFADDVPDFEKSNGFAVVTCSYLMEHPMYATVLIKGSTLELRMLQKMKIELTQPDIYKIESHHSILKASSNSVDFYSVCNRCSKKSVSTVYLNSSNEDVLCKTKDYFDRKFTVYGSGKILHKNEDEDFISPEYEEEGSKDSLRAAKRGPGCCEHHKLCKPHQRCLVMDRDLTGIEFINERILYRYIGNLSDETYYDLCKSFVGNIRLQHAFFEPVYTTGRESYITKYEENDSYPTRLTRKQLVETRSPTTHVTINTQNVNLQKKEKPKVIIARFIAVIHPDPVTVMQIIANAIALYQKRSNEVTEIYKKHLKERKQFPFANYVAKEINLIASTLCKSLDLYPHTCTTVPYTEMDIHSVGHNFCLNSYFQDVNPDDLRLKILPRCKQILKPFRHKGMDQDIQEHENDQTA